MKCIMSSLHFLATSATKTRTMLPTLAMNRTVITGTMTSCLYVDKLRRVKRVSFIRVRHILGTAWLEKVITCIIVLELHFTRIQGVLADL